MEWLQYTWDILPALGRGTLFTVSLFAITLAVALPLGLPIALGENSKILPIRWICRAYVFVFRGTPLMLQLFFFYFVLPLYFGLGTDAFPTACITFILNYAAYFAEIYRGGINGIDKGQYEAAHSLGLNSSQTMRGIILPQMMRMVLPPISNESIVLIKDTALASCIALRELMQVSRGFVNRDSNMTAYLLAAVIYLIFTAVLTYVVHRVEKKFSAYTKQEEW